VRSSAREIDDDEDDDDEEWAYDVFATIATIVVVVGVVVGVIYARGGGDAFAGASVGEKLAGCWRSVRGVFGGGDSWERRRDPYEDVDAFERADFD
jgi:hypothetical protein